MLLAAVFGLLPGCTLLDKIFPGTFTTEQPKAEVTVVGKINIDRSTGHEEGCSAGRTLLWGTARNTGDVDLDDVFIEISALDANNNVLGTYRVNVFNGDIVTSTTVPPVTTAGTSLIVDQSGTFEACAPLSFGSVASTTYRTDFIVITELK